MADLGARYLGMELGSPLVASSSPLTGSLEGAAAAGGGRGRGGGAASLFEEEADYLRPVEVQVRDWMDRHGVATLDQLRGRLSQRSVPDPAAFERANYIKTLASQSGPVPRRSPASGR